MINAKVESRLFALAPLVPFALHPCVNEGLEVFAMDGDVQVGEKRRVVFVFEPDEGISASNDPSGEVESSLELAQQGDVFLRRHFYFEDLKYIEMAKSNDLISNSPSLKRLEKKE